MIKVRRRWGYVFLVKIRRRLNSFTSLLPFSIYQSNLVSEMVRIAMLPCQSPSECLSADIFRLADLNYEYSIRRKNCSQIGVARERNAHLTNTFPKKKERKDL